jgi:hypothetical protein
MIAALIVIAGAVGYLIARYDYESLPTIPVTAPVLLVLFGLLEAGLAQSVRARLQGRPGTRPILPLTVARTAALAKASSLVGALSAGGYAGLLAYTAATITGSQPEARDARISAIGTAASVLLVLAAQFLERVCRVPPPPDDRPEDELTDAPDRRLDR